MKSFIINKDQENKLLSKVLRENFKQMPVNAMYKAFRKKDIRVSGTKVKEDIYVNIGDKIDIYVSDDILNGTPITSVQSLSKGFSIVYEDTNILIVDKEQGIPVHADKEQQSGTLIDLVKEYLLQKGEYTKNNSSAFPPSLCHRLDRNTGGLVMIAKNSETLNSVLEMLKNKEIHKYYQCLVKGKMKKNYDEIRAYLFKDEKKSMVYIADEPSKGAVEIVTRYKTLSSENDISRLEVELITGRTHQIRAQLAHIGHPIVGDGKYGSNDYNKQFKTKYQALWAYKLVFDFKDAGTLNYLKGKVFQVEPGYRIY